MVAFSNEIKLNSLLRRRGLFTQTTDKFEQRPYGVQRNLHDCKVNIQLLHEHFGVFPYDFCFLSSGLNVRRRLLF